MRPLNQRILSTTLSMAWPAIVESFFVAFAGLVDSYMVSSLGANAVASVGLTTQPKFVALALFFALNVAVSALVARRVGEGRRDDANTILATAVAFLIVMAVIISVIFVWMAPTIMDWCGSTPQTHDGAVTYFRIIIGGMIFNCLQMCINSAQRGAGNTRITMVTNVTSNTVNIIFNYLLIGGHFGFPAWGIAGAAFATVLGTVVASILSIRSILPKDNFISIPYMLREKCIPTLRSLTNLIRVGYSVFFEQLLMRIGFVLTAVMAAHQGNAAMAAHQVGMNILALTFAFGDGLQSTAVALIGRSLGERNPELAKEYGRTCKVTGTVIAAGLFVVYYFSARWLYGLFFQEEEIITIGVGIMRIVLFIVLFQVIQTIYMGCLRGAGDTAYTAAASMICVTIIRTAGSYFFGYVMGWGIYGIWCGVLADQFGRYLFSSIRFRQGKWVNIAI